MFGKRGVAMAVSSLVLLGASLAWAPAGEANGGRNGGGALCTGSSHSAYDPPLTLVPQAVDVHTYAHYTCTVAPGRTVAADSTLDGVSPAASCVQLDNPRLTEHLQYADGERSLIVYDSGTGVRAANGLLVRLTGRVVKGRGAGLPAQRTVLALAGQLPTDCLSSGLRGSDGQAQLEVGP